MDLRNAIEVVFRNLTVAGVVKTVTINEKGEQALELGKLTAEQARELAEAAGAFHEAAARLEKLEADSHVPFDFTSLIQRIEALEQGKVKIS